MNGRRSRDRRRFRSDRGRAPRAGGRIDSGAGHLLAAAEPPTRPDQDGAREVPAREAATARTPPRRPRPGEHREVGRLPSPPRTSSGQVVEQRQRLEERGVRPERAQDLQHVPQEQHGDPDAHRRRQPVERGGGASEIAPNAASSSTVLSGRNARRAGPARRPPRRRPRRPASPRAPRARSGRRTAPAERWVGNRVRRDSGRERSTSSVPRCRSPAMAVAPRPSGNSTNRPMRDRVDPAERHGPLRLNGSAPIRRRNGAGRIPVSSSMASWRPKVAKTTGIRNAQIASATQTRATRTRCARQVRRRSGRLTGGSSSARRSRPAGRALGRLLGGLGGLLARVQLQERVLEPRRLDDQVRHGGAARSRRGTAAGRLRACRTGRRPPPEVGDAGDAARGPGPARRSAARRGAGAAPAAPPRPPCPRAARRGRSPPGRRRARPRTGRGTRRRPSGRPRGPPRGPRRRRAASAGPGPRTARRGSPAPGRAGGPGRSRSSGASPASSRGSGGAGRGRSAPGVAEGCAADRRPAGERGEVVEVALAGEVVVERDPAGQVADRAADGDAVADDVEPEHAPAPGRRVEVAQEQADERGLAGAVRPQEAEDLARPTSSVTPRGRGPARSAWSGPRRRSRSSRARLLPWPPGRLRGLRWVGSR